MAVDRQRQTTGSRGGRARAATSFDAASRAGGTSAAHVRLVAALPLFLLALLCGAIVLWADAAPAAAVPPGTSSGPLAGDVKTQVDSLSTQAQLLQTEIATLDQDLELNTESYNQLRLQLDELNTNMARLRRELRGAQTDYQYRLNKYEERLCDLYKDGGNSALLQLLLEADNGEDLIARARVAAELADQDRRLLDNLNASAERLNTVLAQVDETKSEQLVVREQMRTRQEEITTALADRQSTLESIDAQIATIIEQERQRQVAEQERLRQALAQLLNGGQVYDGPLPQTDSEMLNQFLETAAAYIGLPYVWGGDRPSTGMDCSGYTQFVYRQHGVQLPHYSGYQAQMGIPVDYASIQPGDLLAFGFPVHHVGIYVGDDLFIHAAGTGYTIQLGRLSERGDLAAIRRFNLQARSAPPAVN
jgi:cell wall-associated NlpC family hydrolase